MEEKERFQRMSSWWGLVWILSLLHNASYFIAVVAVVVIVQNEHCKEDNNLQQVSYPQ